MAHIISGAYIGVVVAGVLPTELNYILMALISGGILDLDHIYSLVKDRKFYKKNGYSGNLHKARSPFHELFGFFIVGLLTFIMSFFNLKLALVLGLPFMVHSVEDVLMGRSMPFNPIDKTEIHLLPQKKFIKALTDISVIFIFGFLWIRFLNGAN